MVDLRKKVEFPVETRKGDKAPEACGASRRTCNPKLRLVRQDKT